MYRPADDVPMQPGTGGSRLLRFAMHLGEEIIRTLLISQQNNNIKYGLCAATSSNLFTNLY
jgi:hypothetical protein